MQVVFNDSIDILYMLNQKYVLINRKNGKQYYITEKFFDLLKKYNAMQDKNCLSEKEKYVLYKMVDNGVVKEKESEDKDIVFPIRKVNSVGWLKNLQIEVTKRCKLHCLYCYHDKFEDENMSIDFFKHLVNQAVDMGTDTITITGGEPFLHPHIKELLQYVHDKRLGLVVYTNGQCIDSSMVEFLKSLNIKYIQVSLDSFEKDINDYQRNAKGSTDKVKKIMEQLVRAKIAVKVSTVVSKLNAAQLKQMSAICEAKKCSFGFDFMITDENSSTIAKRLCLSPNEYVEKVRRAFGNEFNKVSKERSNYCGIGKSLLYICVDGAVKLCPSEEKACLKDGLDSLSLQDAYEKVVSQYSMLRCSDAKCKYYEFCSGGCRNRAHLLSGALDKADPVQCIFMQMYK